MAGVGVTKVCDDVVVGDGVGIIVWTVKQAMNTIYAISYIATLRSIVTVVD